MPNLKLLYLDPYYNSFEEDTWIIKILVCMFCIICTISICLMIGIVIFEKFGVSCENWKLLDGLISFMMLASIISMVSNMILVTYNNIFGHFDNLNIVIGLLSLRLFGRLSLTIAFIEVFLVWYITSLVFIKKSKNFDPNYRICQFQYLKFSKSKSFIQLSFESATVVVCCCCWNGP